MRAETAFARARPDVRKALLLCAVTDRHWIALENPNPRGGVPDQLTLEDQVAECIRGGATMVQLREKKLGNADFIALAKRIKAITAARGVPLVINDSLEVALASGADGLHIGQDDGDPEAIRKRLGPRAILGVSAHSAEEARAAERAGADYIGIGAVFPTGSKDGVSVLAPEAVRAITSSVGIPAVAIGGITAENAARLSGLGLAGVAAISAIFAEPDRVREATARLAAAARSVADESRAGERRAEDYR